MEARRPRHGLRLRGDSPASQQIEPAFLLRPTLPLRSWRGIVSPGPYGTGIEPARRAYGLPPGLVVMAVPAVARISGISRRPHDWPAVVVAIGERSRIPVRLGCRSAPDLPAKRRVHARVSTVAAASLFQARSDISDV